jgi:hypothetical protein
MKHYSPTGRKKYGRPLKRRLDAWDRNGSTSVPTPWQTYDDDDDDDTDISEGYVASIIRLEKRVDEKPGVIIMEARYFSETSVHVGQTVYRHLSEGSYVPSLLILRTVSTTLWAKFNVTWFQASAAKQMRTALFWAITQRLVVISDRRFGATYRYHP